jgi:hypothetical protein
VVAVLASLGACAPARSPAESRMFVPTHSETSLINAEIKGVLERRGACMRLRLPGGGAYIPVWPAGTAVEGARVRLPQGPATRGGTARTGDRATLLGTREIPPGAVLPSGCGTSFFTVVQLVRRGR